MLTVSCQDCGKRYQVEDQYAGRTAQCQACKGPVPIPALDVPAARPARSGKGPAAAVAAPKPPSRPERPAQEFGDDDPHAREPEHPDDGIYRGAEEAEIMVDEPVEEDDYVPASRTGAKGRRGKAEEKERPAGRARAGRRGRAEEEDGAGGGKKTMLIGIVVAVVLIGGGLAYYFTRPGDDKTKGKPTTPSQAGPQTPAGKTGSGTPSPAPAAYTPIVVSLEPKAFVTSLDKAIQDMDAAAIWAHLPESKRKELTDLIHQAAGKMDAELWNGVAGVLKKFARVVKEKKALALASQGIGGMLKNPLGPDAPPEAKFQIDGKSVDAFATENWDGFAAALEALANSDLGDVNKLKTVDVEKFLATSFNPLLAKLKPVAGAMAPPRPKHEFVEISGETLKVKITSPEGEVTEESWKKIDKGWAPEELIAGLDQQIAGMKAWVESLKPESFVEPKKQIMPILAAANVGLDNLLAAKTAEEFDNAWTGFVAGIGAAAAFDPSSLFGGGPKPPGGDAPPPPKPLPGLPTKPKPKPADPDGVKLE